MAPSEKPQNTACRPPAKETANGKTVRRIRSSDLFGAIREVEIEHDGRIYRLRLTQLNKLILTA